MRPRVAFGGSFLIAVAPSNESTLVKASPLDEDGVDDDGGVVVVGVSVEDVVAVDSGGDEEVVVVGVRVEVLLPSGGGSLSMMTV